MGDDGICFIKVFNKIYAFEFVLSSAGISN
jgi:hypothetical protein